MFISEHDPSAAPSQPRAPAAAGRPDPPREAVLIRRAGAMGDVIMTTPVAARLRHQLGPAAIIDVETRFPDVYANNPHINGVNAAPPVGGYHRVIELDRAYERRPHHHAVDAYMLEAFSDAQWPCKQLYLHRASIDHLAHLPWRGMVALHAAANASLSRAFPKAFWEEILDGLLAEGLTPVILGDGQDLSWPYREGVIDLVGRLSLHEAASVIDRSRCFVTGDTGLSHVAAATQTPIIGLYTQVLAERRMAWRNGVLGWGVTPLAPDLDCIGCLTAPWTPTHCRRGDFACVQHHRVDSRQVLHAVTAALGLTAPLPAAPPLETALVLPPRREPAPPPKAKPLKRLRAASRQMLQGLGL